MSYIGKANITKILYIIMMFDHIQLPQLLLHYFAKAIKQFLSNSCIIF